MTTRFTMSEMSENAGQIVASARTAGSVIPDADIGYGDGINLVWTIREYERHGVRRTPHRGPGFPRQERPPGLEGILNVDSLQATVRNECSHRSGLPGVVHGKQKTSPASSAIAPTTTTCATFRSNRPACFNRCSAWYSTTLGNRRSATRTSASVNPRLIQFVLTYAF